MGDDEDVLQRILEGKEGPTNLSLALLSNITDHFSEERKIGHGGFGAVYKGVLQNRITVAVKRIYVNLENIEDDDKQFGREFNSLWNTNHENLVRFLGFCSNTCKKPIQKAGSTILADVRERLFCFEYISNGSLDMHITDELRGFEWEARYEIISGICEGLHYLHVEKTIIHMDLKPENILLDHQDGKYMVPKITDFGLSRPNEKSHTVGKIYGTRGYCAPEYREGTKTTPACDIYSLGAIIMELITGYIEVPNKDNVFRRWRHRWRKPPTPLQYQRVTRCMEIAVRCREKKPEARPSISEIISLLSESESTGGNTGQEISTYFGDDMLGIKPLELHFTSKLKKDDTMHGIVRLTNKTKRCFAFSIETPSKQYTIWPEKGIVPSGCLEYPVQITVQPEETVPQVTHNTDKFIVRSRKVSDYLGVEGVTQHMFSPEAGKVVDEVDLMVVYGPVSLKRGREPNVPVEVVSHKAVKSSSYKHCAQGQCTKQLDRRNFHPPENFSNNQPTNMTYLLRDSDRAMSATIGAIGSLLHKLGVLHKEFNLGTSIEEDAEELVNMQEVVRKVSDVQQDEQLVKRWASNVREMSYNLEDFVDGFLVNSKPDSDASGVMELTHDMYFSSEKGKSHQSFSNLIKHHISIQVQDAAEKGKKYKVNNMVANASGKAAIDDLRISAIYGHKDRLVGIRAPRDDIIGLLKVDGDKNQELRIVSIVGLGGMGKTTLAKAVYDEFKGRYHTRAFVPVGRNPDVKNILKSVMYELQKGFDAESMSVHQLIKELNELLEDKRYFIVIDDIWDSSTWKLIHSSFPRNGLGSRVITTTRIHDIALATCNAESEYVYKIKPLSDEDSRMLFYRRTFPKGDFPDTPRKEEISQYILKQCGGMPLAINSIASLLTVGEPDSTWENVWKSLVALTEWKTERKNDIDNMKQILDLSYMYLPDDLKTCLLYVCMYPEDREIQKNDLLRQWIAEGFVSRKGRLGAKDVAENNFKALINMFMIEPGRIDYYNNEVLSCRVHDIILDLMRSKSSEANFIQVIDGLQDVSGPRGEIRRVSVHNKDREDGRILETIKGSLSHARSVLLYRRILLPDFLKYKYVRVLHLEDQAYSEEPLDLTGIGRFFFPKVFKDFMQ